MQRDGTVWFTDPDYGLPSDPATRQRVGKEQPGNYVYRYDVRTSKLTAAVRDLIGAAEVLIEKAREIGQTWLRGIGVAQQLKRLAI